MDAVDEPYRSVVEIRIHGVSGTAPEDLLEAGPVRQTAGDRVGGFYRPTQPERMRDNVPGGPQTGPWMEAYSWGGWTSGARSRALWIILLPFALVNVAPRMLPPSRRYTGPPDDDAARLGVDGKHRFIYGLVRLLSLSLTVAFLFGVCQLSFVVVGRRCALLPNVDNPTRDACFGVPQAVTRLLAELSPSWALALSALLPMLVLGLLWLLSTRATQRYEDVEPEVDIETDVRPDDDRLPLGRRDLWRGSRRIRRLRMLHVQAGFASIGVLLGGLFPFRYSGVVTVLGLVILGLAAGLVVFRPRNRSTTVLRARWLWLALGGQAIATLVMILLAAADPTWQPDPNDLVVTMNGWYIWLYGLQLIALVILAVVLAVLAAEGRRLRVTMHFNGFGTFVFVFLGLLTGALFSAGLLILVPIWLYTDSFLVGQVQIDTFLATHPSWFGTATLNAGFGLVAALVALLVILLVNLWGAGRALLIRPPAVDVRHVDQQYGAQVSDEAVPERVRRYWRGESEYDDPRAHERTGRSRQIRTVFWLARRVDYAPAALTALVLGLGAVVLVQVVGTWINRSGGSFDFLLVPESSDGAAVTVRQSSLLAWGAYLMVLVVIGVIAVAVASYRRAGTRRSIGVLWDLTCFWPRDVHPFAPPCYTERIVPEVTTRMSGYLGRADNGSGSASAVVLAAHSQGTVISMAVLLAQPNRFPMERVALLTCGTVLDRLYSRFFPRYFSLEAFQRLNLRLGGAQAGEPSRWTNLWRHSDFLGGPLPFESSRQETRSRKPLDEALSRTYAAVHAATAAARSALALHGLSAGRADQDGRVRSTVQAALRATADARTAALAADTVTEVSINGKVDELVSIDGVDRRRRLAAAETTARAGDDAVSIAQSALTLARSALQDLDGARSADEFPGPLRPHDVAAAGVAAAEAAARAANAVRAVAAEALARRTARWVDSADSREFAGRGGETIRTWPTGIRLIDPVFETPPDDIVAPPARKHSGYWNDPEFQTQIGVLTTLLPQQPPVESTGVQPPHH